MGTHHNFLVYGTRGLKADFGGHDNHHFGNIYAHIAYSLAVQTSTLVGHEDYFYDNRVVATTNTTYVHCNGARTQMFNNSYYTPDGLFYECDKSLADIQAEGMDLGSTVTTLPNRESILRWASNLLQISNQF